MTWTKAEFDSFYNFKAEKFGHWGGRAGIRLHYHDFVVGQYQRSIYAPLLFTTLGMNAGDSIVLVGPGFNWTGEGLEALGVDVVGTDLSDYIQNEKVNTEEAEIRAICTAAGVNPEVDGILWDENDPRTSFVVEAERIPEITVWLTDPREAESRAMWESVHGSLSATNATELSRRWKLNPLEVWLRGGLTNPQPRGHGTILQEDIRNRGSRNAVFNRLNGNPRFIITEEVLNSITDAEADLVCSYMQDFVRERGGSCVHMLSPQQPTNNPSPLLNWKPYTGPGSWREWLNTNGYSTHQIICTVAYGGPQAYEVI